MVEPQKRPMTREQKAHRTRLALVLILVALVLVFAFQNRATVNIDFLVTNSDMRLIFVIIGSAILGATIGALVRTGWRHRQNR